MIAVVFLYGMVLVKDSGWPLASTSVIPMM